MQLTPRLVVRLSLVENDGDDEGVEKQRCEGGDDGFVMVIGVDDFDCFDHGERVIDEGGGRGWRGEGGVLRWQRFERHPFSRDDL